MSTGETKERAQNGNHCKLLCSSVWPRTNTLKVLFHFQFLRGYNHPNIRHGCVGLLGRRERGAVDGIED